VDLVSIVFIGIIVVASFLYALFPLVRPPDPAGIVPDEEGASAATDREVSRLLMDRDHAYKNIMEVEFDKEMGKLSDEDYEEMIGRARGLALEVLRRLEARGVREGMVGVHLNERDASEAAVTLAAAPAGPPRRAVASPAAPREAELDGRLEAEILRYREASLPVTGGEAPEAAAPGEKAEAPKAAASVRFCPSCGSDVGSGHNFCAACGHKLR